MDKLFRAQLKTMSCIANFFENSTTKVGLDRQTLDHFEARIDLLETYWKTFVERHDELFAFEIDLKDTDYVKNDLFMATEDAYISAKARIKSRIRSLKPSTVIDNNPQQRSVDSVKLPPLALPTFSGKQEEWESFKQRFSSLIRNRESISNVAKLQHLLNAVQGQAAQRLKGLDIIDTNFEVAWEKLVRRYDNTRIRLFNNLEKLFQLPTVRARNVQDLNDIIDRTEEAVRALRDLNCPVDRYDNWLVHSIVRKLDQASREKWEVSQEACADFSTYSDLSNFLERRVHSLEQSRVSSTSQDGHSSQNSSSRTTQGARRVSANAAQTTSSSPVKSSCPLCDSPHPLYICQKFNAMTQPQRFELCKKKKLCLNCLHRNHFTNKCPSTKTCLACQGKHHTKLHNPTAIKMTQNSREHNSQEDDSSKSELSETTSADPATSTSALTAVVGSTVLLATASVILSDHHGNKISIRALIDPGAERSFITHRAASLLFAKTNKVSVAVFGVGAEETSRATSEAHLILRSNKDARFQAKFSALVLNELTRLLPARKLDFRTWPHINGLELADPNFSQPRKVDCILGADIYADIILEGLIQGPIGTPVAQKSVFGWLLTGVAAANKRDGRELQVRVFHTFTEPSISDALVKFWELEEIPRGKFLTSEDSFCEEQFVKTHYRNEEGRFVVRLPFSSKPTFIGSRDIAAACLLRSERRLQRNAFSAELYEAFMQEYIALRHMELVPRNQLEKPTCYLPHHSVFRQDNPGKIRVVFNASQKASNGLSLNDVLLPGPKLQADISVVLTNWRFLRFAFTTDVVKMFRQILIHPDDREYQRILWRKEPTQPIQDYRALTVTYGTASAPFLALRVMRQLAIDGAQTHPEAAATLQHQLYVDDIFSGANDLQEAVRRRDQLILLLATAGMELGKWATNEPRILQGLTSSPPDEIDVKLDEVVSTLGLKWLPSSDKFIFKISSLPKITDVTKRSILSEIARLFDPLGWLAPTLVTAKIMLQDLWLTNLGWDTSLQGQLRQDWLRFRDELLDVSSIQVPRWLGASETDEWHLHGFADASKRAYAAAIYAVIPGRSAMLLMAKTKVAPTKVQTLPRLELCGGILLVRLAKHLLANFRHPPKQIVFWTDSKVVLDWLKGHPSKWPTFVANRTSEILTTFPAASWHHVRSADNPADCATRGVSPSQLASFNLWWHGPSWLTQHEPTLPLASSSGVSSDEEIQTYLTQDKVQATDTVPEAFCLSFLQTLSSFSKMIRVLAYCARWKLNSGKRDAEKRKDYLTFEEIKMAKLFYFRAIQLSHFANEIRLLSVRKPLSPRNHLAKLSPFVDSEGLLRVGGRLQNSLLPYNQKHPIILPGNCLLVRRVVEETHSLTLHGGIKLMLANLHRTLWIIRGSRIATGVYQRCKTCIRFSPHNAVQQMGPLPAVRVTPASPFEWTGLDYAGPVPVLFSKGRGAKSTKGYVAIFICMVSRAIHIEIVSNLTADVFMAAFERFCARRGTPAVMHSDNATTFKAAAAELEALFARSSPFMQKVVAQAEFKGTKWEFIPPRAPHFGGLWEAAVRSFKHHFKRVVGDSAFTFEELSTLAAKIESCLNSRPLCPNTNDSSSPTVLTPADCLIGKADTSIPEPLDTNPEPKSSISRWRLLTSLRNAFWLRWQKEVLHQLQQRNKWLKPQPNLKRGDVVLIKDELTAPTKWPLGLIKETHPGPDGLVRVATVSTATSTLKRPIVKLIKLPTEPELEEWYHQYQEKQRPITAGGKD